MTDPHYAELRRLLETVLANQQVLSDEIERFKVEMRGEFGVQRTKLDLGRATTQVVDSHCEIVREEVRIIKSLIAQQVLPRLGAEFPNGHIPLEWPGPEGLPQQPKAS